MSNPDVTLLQLASRFEEQALAEIYDRFSPGLYRYAMRLLGDAAQAEDCVAETFSRFLRTLKARNGPNAYLQAYLYRIAHNWINDQFRRQPPPPLELDEDWHADPDPAPERQVETRMQQQRLRAALRRLTGEQRQVIALRFLEEWSLEDTAAALQKPVGAVKSLQHRALAALQRMLAAEEELNETDG